MIVSKHTAVCSSMSVRDSCPTRKYQFIYGRKDSKVKKVSSKSWSTPNTLLHAAVCLNGMAVTSHSFTKCTLALACRLSHLFFHLNATKYRLHDKITGRLDSCRSRRYGYFQGWWCEWICSASQHLQHPSVSHVLCVFKYAEFLHDRNRVVTCGK